MCIQNPGDETLEIQCPGKIHFPTELSSFLSVCVPQIMYSSVSHLSCKFLCSPSPDSTPSQQNQRVPLITKTKNRQGWVTMTALPWLSGAKRPREHEPSWNDAV